MPRKFFFYSFIAVLTAGLIEIVIAFWFYLDFSKTHPAFYLNGALIFLGVCLFWYLGGSASLRSAHDKKHPWIGTIYLLLCFVTLSIFMVLSSGDEGFIFRTTDGNAS